MTDRLPGRPPLGSEGETIGATGAEGQGRLVGRRYRLVSPVGRGGMGVVWHAHDVLLDRDVAVKELILPQGLDHDGTRAAHRRMLREARSAARLSHPGIVTVHDVVEEDGRPWIVMELVRAWSLEQAVRHGGPLPVVQAAEIGVRVLDALRHAHSAGILHRDVKPGNVLLAPDRTVLTDFGIAAIEGDVSVTQSGLLMGSPAYIPPERLSGGSITYAADLWSFGATLYTAVEGRPPYEGPDPVAVLGAILTQEPNRPQRAGALIAVIEGLLRRNPADRMTAAQVSDLLDRVLRSHGSATSGQVATARAVSQTPLPDDLASIQLVSPLVPPPNLPSGPAPSRIIETPSGPVRVPHGFQTEQPGDPSDSGEAPADRGGSRRGSRRRAAGRAGGRGAKGRWTRGGRPTPLLILICAIAVLAAVAAALFALPPSGASPAPQSHSAPSPTLPVSASPSPSRARIPDGYRTLSAGHVSAALPREWTVGEGKGGAVTFSGPKNSGRSIVVTEVPVTDPVTALGTVTKDGLEEYTEIGVTAVPYGTWKAADWEYTYVRPKDAVPMHGLTRYVAVGDRGAYLISFTAPDLDWEKNAELLPTFFATFLPTG